MKNIDQLQPQIEKPKKLTKTSLCAALEELNMKYTIDDGEAGNFKIIINLPEDHIQEKEELTRGHILNDAYHTKFDNEKFRPFIRKIGASKNLGCKIENTGDQYIVSVFKKY